MATLSKSVAQHIRVLHFLVCSPSELQIISAFPTLGLKNFYHNFLQFGSMQMAFI